MPVLIPFSYFTRLESSHSAEYLAISLQNLPTDLKTDEFLPNTRLKHADTPQTDVNLMISRLNQHAEPRTDEFLPITRLKHGDTPQTDVNPVISRLKQPDTASIGRGEEGLPT